MRRLTTALACAALLGTPAAAGADWTTYSGSATRAGVAHGAPANPGLRRRFARTVDGQIYAQPLIAGGRIYVATENNSVYAFSSSGKQLWRRHLGAPVDGGSLPCGNIDPSGITGTPVIAHGRLFAVAFLGAGKRHVLFGLSLRRNGRIVVRRNVDPPNREVHQERAALTAVHGRIYVPYGGLAGDCGPFRGRIVSVTEGGHRRISFKTPATEAGIWTPGGLSAQSGTLLAATGNGGSGPFGYQNSVIRLSLRLHRLGFWAPANWASLSASDADINSIQPLPVSGGLVFQIGKTGIGWLLRHSLGGVGKELFSARVCGGAAFGADAFRAPLAIVPCGGSLYGLRIEGNRFTRAWTASGGRVPVIAGNSVYALTGGGLNQIRLSDGHLLAHAEVAGGDTSFPGLAIDGRTLVAPAGRGIVVFRI
ncbi:MAG: PQQ-binding-like beta-propeller repeat protein [Thermoleophilaceae bacterium]